ncbi:cytochrome P450 [Aspergillus brunneoviolaceus CBS 621.78]|uniref:Cytochrome P450 monooxygenase n=1 Tax=Aspergillus brunneoviolaceus CBS 621.78 TaxID=1450534 RepID=A0ACD1GJ56_9EURO|nr:cytochrome P450 monooxygenase [Aspergillus brunneoviolaceus CBS 621.78]RAH49192.1 cytochrome P450 monooxygenase [Aspergillus brunneoviolaceus CBS 621.78]
MVSQYWKTIAFIAAACVFIWIKYTKRWPSHRLPPGPRGLPLIGNLHQFPSSLARSTFDEWHKQYGPIVGLSLGQRPAIIIGSASIANELFAKRGRIYSSRPRMVMALENLSHGMHTVFLPYGPQWRAHNRIHKIILAPSKALHFHELLEAETKLTLRDLLHSKDWDQSIVRFTSSVVYSLAYGQRLQGDEPEIREMSDFVEETMRAISGSWLVDILPFINKLPSFLNPWKRFGNRFHQQAMRIFAESSRHAIEAPGWNFTKHVQTKERTSHFSDEELLYVVGVLFQAGIDSTSTAFRYCILACILHRDKVTKAQQELDAVVGKSRLPSLDDIAELPYTKAFINEVLRWRPITVGSLAHCSSEHDTFMGYDIPKGSVVILNHWSTVLNADTYGPDAASFRPERWIEDPNLPLLAFGCGRRACSGQYLAQKELEALIPSILWTFDIEVGSSDETKLKLDPWDLLDIGGLLRPPPFPASFIPRDEERRTLIERESRKVDAAGLQDILNRIQTRLDRG